MPLHGFVISAFAKICMSPYRLKIVRKLQEYIITAKQDVLKIALVRREHKLTQDITIVIGHLVANGRMYDPQNAAGQSFGKGADLAVLLNSDG